MAWHERPSNKFIVLLLLPIGVFALLVTTSYAWSPLENTLSYARRSPKRPLGGRLAGPSVNFRRELDNLNILAAPAFNNSRISATTDNSITYATASDGSGSGFSGPAIIWIVFALVLGLPMSFAGYRGYRITAGVAVGLALCVTCWAAIVNSLGPDGVSDYFIVTTVISFFVLGFFVGYLRSAHYVGVFCLGFLGAVSLGVRLVIIRPNLLIQGSTTHSRLNWIIPISFGVLGVLGVFHEKASRVALLLSCTLIGTFFSALGLDLLINQQSGMSRGLRCLFDGNQTHYQDLFVGGYNPPVSTVILLVISVCIAPALAYAQARVFKSPFNRKNSGYYQDEESEGVSLDLESSSQTLAALPVKKADS